MQGSGIFSLHLYAFYHRVEQTSGDAHARALVMQIRQQIASAHQDGLLKHDHLDLFSVAAEVDTDTIHRYLQTLPPAEQALLKFTLYAGYGLDAAKRLSWATIGKIWHSLPPILQELVNRQLRNTQSNLLFSSPTPQGYQLPALTEENVQHTTGYTHQALVTSFNMHLVAQSSYHAETIRQHLGITGI